MSIQPENNPQTASSTAGIVRKAAVLSHHGRPTTPQTTGVILKLQQRETARRSTPVPFGAPKSIGAGTPKMTLPPTDRRNDNSSADRIFSSITKQPSKATNVCNKQFKELFC